MSAPDPAREAARELDSALAAYDAERLRAAEARIRDRARARLERARRPRPDTAETEAPEG